MSEQNKDLNSTEVKKVSLQELMRRKLESQKIDQQKGQSFNSTKNSGNKVKSQQNRKSTLHRARTGE